MKAATAITMTQRNIDMSMERLSTGKRINSAADDAAGVAIASRLTSEIRGTNQAIRNAMDGQALIDTAEGAHNEIENILQRMRELAIQGASDTNNANDRKNLQIEMDALSAEIDRIASTTTWAGQSMISNEVSNFSFQVGTATGTNNQIAVAINSMSAGSLKVGGADPSLTTPQKVGSEFQVNTYTSGAQGDPAITNLSNGGFVITWTNESSQDGSGYGVFGQIFDASGNTVGAEFQVNTYTSNNQRHPDISGLSDGGFVVTWHSRHQDGDDQGIFGQRFDASGNKVGSEFQVNTHTTSFQQYSAVAALSDGGFVVTWHDDSGHDGSGYGVFGQKYTSSGSASGSQFQINSTTASTQAYPSITSLTDGGFVVTWTDYSGQDGSDKGIFGQRYDASGNTVASEFQINTQTSGDQSWSDIESLSNGGFVVTWTGLDASGNGVYAQRYSASGEKEGSEFLANTYQSGNEMHSEVTSLADGGYVITWYSDTHTDDTNYGVHGQRFDASGTAVGSQFLANTDVANAQKYPETASLTDSGFVITWQSYTQDGSNYGIFAQRFDAGVSTVPVANSSLAKATISQIDAAITTVNSQRSKLGSISNRLSHTVGNLTNAVANISVSKGRIEDADFATETTNLAKFQILQQAATAMLVQANASKQNILTLLNI